MHILIATDGSQQSREAARYITAMVNPDTVTDITVLAVIRPLTTAPFVLEFGGGLITEDSWNRLNSAAEQAANEAITCVVEELSGFKDKIHDVIREGSPADEIVHEASTAAADLIVIGSRGHGEMRSVLMGSVSERVMHTAHCPVLIWRPIRKLKVGNES